MKGKETYFGGIFRGWRTMLKGMRLSGKHLKKGFKRDAPLSIMDEGYFDKVDGPITIQYPMEKVAVPDNGRYRLHMETDDCIACDKCARICPVDCITIESFRADGDLGRTSDGTVKRLHLPTFDIDMGKCMYCGLCTTVCPTECLTMTKVYDFSEFDRDNFVYHFGAYSPEEEVRIRKETEAALAEKKAAKAAAGGGIKKRPVMRKKPVVKRLPQEETTNTPSIGEETAPPRKRPVRRARPVMKPKTEDPPEATPETAAPAEETEAPKPKKRPRPVMRRKPAPEAEPPQIETPAEETEAPKPQKRPRPIRYVFDRRNYTWVLCERKIQQKRLM
ncbi:MAG: 4Fe-4S binding protein [Bacteroidota bacterium]